MCGIIPIELIRDYIHRCILPQSTQLFNISIKHLYETFQITQFSDYSSIELFR